MANEFPLFERKLIEYLPPVMRDVDEMKQIMATEQPEVYALWKAVQRVLNEQFLDSATEYGVLRWESILKITPPPTDTLDQRKDRIYLILRMKLPYTIRWLRGWLNDNIGEGNYSLDINLYTIQMELLYDRWPDGHKVYLDVLDLLGWVRPSNMVLGITGKREIDGVTKIKGWPEQGVEIELGGHSPRIFGVARLCAMAELQTTIEIFTMMEAE